MTTPDLDGIEARANAAHDLDEMKEEILSAYEDGDTQRIEIATDDLIAYARTLLARAEKAENMVATALADNNAANLENEAALVKERSRAEAAEAKVAAMREALGDIATATEGAAGFDGPRARGAATQASSIATLTLESLAPALALDSAKEGS